MTRSLSKQTMLDEDEPSSRLQETERNQHVFLIRRCVLIFLAI